MKFEPFRPHLPQLNTPSPPNLISNQKITSQPVGSNFAFSFVLIQWDLKNTKVPRQFKSGSIESYARYATFLLRKERQAKALFGDGRYPEQSPSKPLLRSSRNAPPHQWGGALRDDVITAAKETISGSDGTFPSRALDFPKYGQQPVQPNLSHETQIENQILFISGIQTVCDAG